MRTGHSLKSRSRTGSNPHSLASNTDIDFHQYYNGRYGETISQSQSVLAMKSDFLLAHLWLSRALLEMRNFDTALVETAVAEGKARDWSVRIAAHGITFGVVGMTGQAQAVLREMEALSRQRFVTAYGIALAHAGLGHKDDAVGWLDRVFDERSHWPVWLRLDPCWQNLRDDPRFATLIESTKYPAWVVVGLASQSCLAGDSRSQAMTFRRSST